MGYLCLRKDNPVAQLVPNQARVVLRVFDEDETKRFARVSRLHGQTCLLTYWGTRDSS